jgi:hypothetical protein
MAVVAETRPAALAFRRRTAVLRPFAWLVCWLLEIPSIDDLDHAGLDAYIAALAEQDRESRGSRGGAGTGPVDAASSAV